ncbi:MAG TPA: hypothetical protein VF290_18155 [Pyrinomonadaceae bacterium]
MSRWTAQDLADYQAKHRGLKIEMLSVEPKTTNVRIDREVKHDYKADFEQQLSLVGIQVEREFYFALPRRWRSDWKVKTRDILIEFEGGLFKKRKAGHSSVRGILRDIAKGNAAALLGFVLIRIAPPHVVSGQALKWVEQAVAQTSQSKSSAET